MRCLEWLLIDYMTLCKGGELERSGRCTLHFAVLVVGGHDIISIENESTGAVFVMTNGTSYRRRRSITDSLCISSILFCSLQYVGNANI